jgi:DNA-binding transcriptional MocR family regulator
LQLVHVVLQARSLHNPRAILAGAKPARGSGTPAHQTQLCVSYPSQAVGAVGLSCAKYAWIIEEDYDCEYRYVSRPPPALKSLDRDGRVLYAGTFSNVLL